MRVEASSRWMKRPNYGRAIVSPSARYSARYYRIIIAAFVMGLLLIEAARSNAALRMLTGVGILLYLAYVMVRLLLPPHWTRRYYTQRVQFWRAQLGIVSVGILVGAYSYYHRSTVLWMLFLLGLMIVSEHCSTLMLLLTVCEISLGLVFIGWVGSEMTFAAYLAFSPALIQAALQALVIWILGFLLHYLVSNVEARDTAIGHYRALLDSLAENVQNLDDPELSRKAVLSACRTMRSAAACSLWILDAESEQLALSGYDSVKTNGDQDPLATSGYAAGRSISLKEPCLPAFVALTNSPHFYSGVDNLPDRLGEANRAPHPLLGCSSVELGIPVPVFHAGQPAARAVLCLSYSHQMKQEEIRHEQLAISETARYLSPILYYTSLVEQLQALQELNRVIPGSLDRDRIFDTLLGLVTRLFGFGFARVWLADAAGSHLHAVREVAVSEASSIPADSASRDERIVADLMRGARPPAGGGWENRSNGQAWINANDTDTVRILVPIRATDPNSGQERRIGVLEAGYSKAGRQQFTDKQMDLLRSFVDMAGVAMVNANLYEEVRFRANALEALHHGGQSIQSAVWESQTLLSEIARSAAAVLESDLFLLYGYSEETQQAELLYLDGDIWGKGEPAVRLVGGSILDAIIRERRSFFFPHAQQEPLLVGYGDADGRCRRTFTQRQGVVSFAGLPLLSGDRLLGIMCVNYRQRRDFTESECLVAELFAQQAAMALESVRLRQLDHRFVVTQERGAMARELHHSVTHDIFAIILKARTAIHHLAAGASLHMQALEYNRVARELEHILEIGEDANRRLGFLVSEFNAPILDDHDFCAVLRDMADRIRRYFDIDVDLRCGEAVGAHVPPACGFVLSRVAKEALNNAVRHARCRHIMISYVSEKQGVCLEIGDDGIGFDPERAAGLKHNQGIKNMRAYLRSVDGHMDLVSTPGQGTHLRVYVPCPRLPAKEMHS